MRQIVAAHGCLPVLLRVQQLQCAAIANPLPVLFLSSVKLLTPLAFLRACKNNENHYRQPFQGYPLPLVTPFSSGLLASQPRPRQASHIFIQEAARYSGGFQLFN